MDRHYPNSAWLSLRRDIFERLCAFKRENGIATWEETVERLLRETEISGSRPNLSNSKLQVPTIQNSEFKTQNSKLPEEVVA
jgi:hypothetical protein